MTFNLSSEYILRVLCCRYIMFPPLGCSKLLFKYSNVSQLIAVLSFTRVCVCVCVCGYVQLISMLSG